MTIVEFYDLDSMKNIAAACCYNPETLVFVCEKSKVSQVQKKAIFHMVQIRDLKAKVFFYEVSRTNMGDIYELCQKIAEKHKDCVFDLTGGRELMLITAGIFCKENCITAFYLDLVGGKLINVVGCEKYETVFDLPPFNVAQILKLYGATYESTGHEGHVLEKYDFNEILNIFDVFKNNVHLWAGFVKYLHSTKTDYDAGCFFTGAKIPELYNKILIELNELGVIHSLVINSKSTSFHFKNSIIKKWMSIQGVWLELFTYIAAIKSGYFDDVKMSVILKWDTGKFDIGVTKNEIDVILVKNARPIFISCKTSLPDTFALNEIRLLSTKFGGNLAKTVIVTSKNISKEHNNSYQRAKLLKVCVVEFEDLQIDSLGKMLIDITTGLYKYK